MSEGLSTALPPVKRRNAELVMVLFAIAITLFAMIEAGLTRNQEMPPSLFVYGLLFGGLAVLAHVFIRFFAPYADPLLLPLAVLLNGLGIAMLWRLFEATGDTERGSAMDQLILTAGSLVVFAVIVFFLKEPRTLQRYPYVTALSAVVLLLLPLIPGLGQTVNGARQWINLGVTSLQPSEFAKISLVIFLSGYMVMKRDVLSLASKRVKIGPVKIIDLPRMRDTAPMAVMWGFCILVLVGLMNDLGTSLLLFGTFLAMIYVATQRSSWIVIGLGAFFGACALLYPFVYHFSVRVDTWINAFDEDVFYGELGANSQQLVQGLFALGEGGILGTGLGGGKPGNVPEVQNDFIFTAFGEELGLTGVMVMLLALALLVERGMRIALASRELFVKMFASGISFLLAFQSFVVIGGVTRVIPMTGATIPFVAKGGSALLSSWIMLALLVRMSHNARKPAPQAIQDEGATQVISR
ncbi:FtsW/RodA/SpoVE family cell cycle protein [Marinactinospora thermotolerans]|uniref:Cell elongation-specific peptidoglycan biosynthesis regulator RodA n=1 Tax=Marinactinospora thermotolerans DSM 45154 TaxID=1122192 RepID=A0A1T4T2V7_9ACTN|nr:FtsW/RodA/SpoVE family cell cycle protein [Marinactinospora thermotolerans]SKA34815.1 cell elongation-specific peptidoglycan biosynthesis regulator RodA [Marinactinospora thermotolerans DSM 45154]